MKLFLLKQVDEGPDYDQALGFVVAAASPEAARRLVESEAEEAREVQCERREKAGVWLDSAGSTCDCIAADSVFTEEQIVLRDFLYG